MFDLKLNAAPSLRYCSILDNGSSAGHDGGIFTSMCQLLYDSNYKYVLWILYFNSLQRERSRYLR